MAAARRATTILRHHAGVIVCEDTVIIPIPAFRSYAVWRMIAITNVHLNPQ